MKQSDDVLTIDENLKGIEFELAHCCHPIYGDPIFGFVTINKGIKIHRTDCPNARELRRRFGYRIVRARWSGKGTSKYALTVTVVLVGLLMIALIYLSFALAYGLGELIGNVWGFCIVAAIYLFILVVFIIFRHQWIERPLVKFLAGILMQK